MDRDVACANDLRPWLSNWIGNFEKRDSDRWLAAMRIKFTWKLKQWIYSEVETNQRIVTICEEKNFFVHLMWVLLNARIMLNCTICINMLNYASLGRTLLVKLCAGPFFACGARSSTGRGMRKETKSETIRCHRRAQAISARKFRIHFIRLLWSLCLELGAPCDAIHRKRKTNKSFISA